VTFQIQSSIFGIGGLVAGVRRKNGQDAIAGFQSERTRFSNTAGMPVSGMTRRVGPIDSGVQRRKVRASYFVRSPAAVASYDHDSGFPPNQALLPTTMAVTPAADAPAVPAIVAADL
jgi:hypothetical protein